MTRVAYGPLFRFARNNGLEEDLVQELELAKLEGKPAIRAWDYLWDITSPVKASTSTHWRTKRDGRPLHGTPLAAWREEEAMRALPSLQDERDREA